MVVGSCDGAATDLLTKKDEEEEETAPTRRTWREGR